ncbi:MAG: hypothetical protein JXR97_14655 [Planctomycetes bacterium]|nr:hypothetical protein [Planctomycetota bacterium]
MSSIRDILLLLLVAGSIHAGEVPPFGEMPKVAEGERIGPVAHDAGNEAAGSHDNDDGMVTVNFRDTEIISVIDYYSKILGKTFIIDNKLKGKVTVISPGPIPKQKALAMLDTILSMHGYGLVNSDGYIKVIQREKIPRDILDSFSENTPADRIATEVISMEYVQASSLLEQIRPLLSQEGNIVVSERLNTLVITDTAGNISKVKKIIQSLDVESKAVKTSVYHLNFASAEKLSASLPNLLSGGDSSGGLKPSVAIDADNNAILLTGTPFIHRRMKELLPSLDRRKGQVLIEAKVVEVSHTASSRFGFEWETSGKARGKDVKYNTGISNFQLDSDKLLDGVSGLRLSFLKDSQWTALLNAYATSEDVNILSCPHLVALDGQTAKLHVGEEIPILKESRVDSNNNPVNSYDYEKVGIDLTIKPKIVDNREIMLEISQEVSTLLQFNEENLTHRIGERLAETSVILKDRHTLVIGGLLKDVQRKANSGVPVIKNIPVLGKLFSQQSQTDSPEKTELLIFITPKLMDNQDEADNVTEEMKERHPETYTTSGEEFRL